MKLLIDSGNTRIKWALVQGKDWICSGMLPAKQVGELSNQLALHWVKIGKQWQDIEQVWVSNVADREVELQINSTVANEKLRPKFIVAGEEQCGVHNGYSHPGQLGSDRWAAMIAAWHLVGSECLVVNCGTATTIDALSDQGEFRGGIVIPGVDIMLISLQDKVARLKTDRGKNVKFPKNTADAIFSGVIQASCGAIQRQYALLDDDNAPVVISGGAAKEFREYLDMPIRYVDNLVLQGLLIISQEASNT